MTTDKTPSGHKRVRGHRMTLLVHPGITLFELTQALATGHMAITQDRRGQLIVSPIPALITQESKA